MSPRKEHAVIQCSAVLAVLVATNAAAQSGTCVSSGAYLYPTPNSNIEYRVNVDDAASFGLTSDELIGATMLAGDIWNQQGNARSFTYIGTTNFKVSDVVGLTQAQCAALGVTYSIVEFDGTNVNPGYTGIDIPICCPSNNCPTLAPAGGTGTGTAIGVYIPSLATGFGNGFSTPGALDLVAELVHEFGHSHGMNHPASGEGSVMNVDADRFPFDPSNRDLYEFDYKCTKQFAGVRAGKAMKISHDTSGTIFPATQIGSLQVAKAMSGVSYVSGVSSFASAYHRGTSISFSQNSDTSYVNVSGISSEAGVGFQQGVWRESPTIDRIFYSHWTDITQYGKNTEHYARTAYSSNKFSSTTYERMDVCTSMTGYLTCSATEGIRSQGVPSMAWWNGDAQTVTAWANMRREGGGTSASSSQIWISVGVVDDNTLPVPTKTPYFSSVPPAVVCRNNFSGTYDCILAYVPATSMENSISVRRFKLSSVATGYSIVFDTAEYVPSSANARTASAITGYRHANGYLYLAFRRAKQGQKIGMYRSTDGASWSSVTANAGTSITAPSAAGVWHNANSLVYVE